MNQKIKTSSKNSTEKQLMLAEELGIENSHKMNRKELSFALEKAGADKSYFNKNDSKAGTDRSYFNKSNSNNTDRTESKIRTSSKPKRNEKRVSSINSTPFKSNKKRESEKDDSLLGSMDTYNTTDTGTQIVELSSPLVKDMSKKTARATFKTAQYASKKVAETVRNPFSTIEKELNKGFSKKNSTNNLKTSQINTRYKRITGIRVDKDIALQNANKTNRASSNENYASKIKTGGYKKNTIRTIKAGTYSIKGDSLKKTFKYSHFKSSNAKTNENDTGNTSYEAMQDARLKKTKVSNAIRAGKNVVTGTSQVIKTVKDIKKDKISTPKITKYEAKIKTGKYVNPHGKKTLEDSAHARQVRKNISTGSSKSNVDINRLQRRSSYADLKGKKEFKKIEGFTNTNATINKRDTGNTSVEAMQTARTANSKIRNTYRGTKNTYKGAQNVKTATSKSYSTGKKIYTKTSKKIGARFKKRKYSTKDLKKQSNVARKSVTAIKNAATKVATVIKQAEVLLNPLVLKGALIGAVLVIFMGVITGIISIIAGSGNISYSYIMAEPEIIVEAKEMVDALNESATNEIEDLLASTGYDDIRLDGPNEIKVGFQDILAIMGVQDEQEYNNSKISGIHSDFYDISTETETYEEEEYAGVCHHDDEEGNCTSDCHDEYEWVEKTRLIITVEQYNFIKIMDDRNFDQEQQNWGMNLAGCNLLDIYPGLADFGITIAGGSLTPEEIENIMSQLPQTGATRENIVAIAEQLVGKISYGWGVKANPPTVPKSLDCSGFTDYVFKLAGAGTIGAGTYGQWDNSYSISSSELKIGDLGFLKPPSQASDSSPNHVGIYVGTDSNGNLMFVHCQGGTGTVKTTSRAGGFSYFRRPLKNLSD